MKKLLLTTLFLVEVFGVNLARATNTSTDTIFSPQTESRCDQYYWEIKDMNYSVIAQDTNIKDTVYRNDTLYTLNLNLKHTWISEIDSRSACDSFVWRGKHLTTSGLVLDTVRGMSLKCDSIYRLDLIINSSRTVDTSATACESFLWNGTPRNTSGEYTKMATDIHGCDSVVTLHLVINRNTSSIVDTTVCDSYIWPLNHQLYSSTTRDSYRLPNSKDCDSIVTLNVTVNYSYSGVDYQHGCDTFVWGGNSYTEQGTYNNVFSSRYSCDSTVTLYLSIDHGTAAIDSITACDSYTWIDGRTYTSNCVGAVWSIPNHKGCDSTITLNLTINHKTNQSEYDTVCGSMLWNNVRYTETGTYVHHYTSPEGCPSIDSLILLVNYGTTSVLADTACDTYLWDDGNTYTESGDVATYTIDNHAGCDSTITLNLVINHSKTITEFITACDSLTWQGRFFNSTNNDTVHFYTVAGCDSAIVLNLTVNHSGNQNYTYTVCDSILWDRNNERYTESGIYTYHYTSQEDCPSIDSLFLTILQSSIRIDSVTACDSHTWINGITYLDNNNGASVIHPNQNAAGCDSTEILNLVINHRKTRIDTITTCDSLIWQGRFFDSSNNDTVNLYTMYGCDSTIILNLTVNHSTNRSTTDTVCDSVSWNGVRYTVTGKYVYHYVSEEGCPSVDSLLLVVNKSGSEKESIVACDSYVWNGVLYTESNHIDTCHIRTIHGCDSLITLDLVVNHNTNKVVYDTACEEYLWTAGYPEAIVGTYLEGGVYITNYQTAEGCPSVDSLFLTVLNNITETRWNDVITLNNKTRFGKLYDPHWYHNGVLVGDKDYYREAGGLSGIYYVEAITKTGDTIISCTQEFDDRPTAKTVPVAMPNPTHDCTIITNGSWISGDAIIISNIQGHVVWTGIVTECGYSELDLGRLDNGIYMVKIGNEVVKVVKH